MSDRDDHEDTDEGWQEESDEEALQAFGRFWFENEPPRAAATFVPDGREEAFDAARAAISGVPPRSVALVGGEGAGKSTVARELAARLREQGWRIFEASSVETMAGMMFLGMLEARLQAVVRLGRKQPLLWVFPDLLQAVGAGAWHRDTTGLIGRMLPSLERGEIVLLAEVRPDDWASLVQLRPRVRQAVQRVDLPPLDERAALQLARERLERTATRVEDATLREALQLADHYLPAAELPGHLLRLVDAAQRSLLRTGDTEVLNPGSVVGALSELTGLPAALLDERRRLDLAEVRAFFERRILGQPDAVGCLVERIALFKAGLTDPTRPLGVFLFVGPTGTGKTELAKSLAEYLFGSPKRLVRLDMSEYRTPDSLERLLAGPESTESSGLIAAVRRQPFSVVLLDEFEKAATPIWDVFLQLFDDGRLTDRSGNTADFRHSVVILTSNLGSAPKASRVGFAPDEQGAIAPAALERAVSQTFRPEFVNRLDRVVVFRPLTRDVMRQLVEKELNDVLGRRGLRTRPWAVEWDASALDFLLEKGFTTDLGARPLKRAVETHVLAPLARAIVERDVPQGDQFLFVRAGGSEIDVQFVDPETELPSAESEGGTRRLEDIVADPRGTPDDRAFLAQMLEQLAGRIRDPGWHSAKQAALARMTEDGFWESPDRFRTLGRAEYLDRIEAGFATAESLARRLHRSARVNGDASAGITQLLAQRLFVLQAALGGLDAGDPPGAYVQVRPGSNEPGAAAFARRLADMYRAWAEKRGMRLEELQRRDGDSRGSVVLGVDGFGALTLLKGETGVHVFETPRDEHSFDRVTAHVVVIAQPPEPADSSARAAAALAGAEAPQTIVRRYREEPSPLVRDSVRGWRTGRLDRVLAGDFDLF